MLLKIQWMCVLSVLLLWFIGAVVVLHKNTWSHEVWHFVKWISAARKKTNERATKQSQPPHWAKTTKNTLQCNQSVCVCVGLAEWKCKRTREHKIRSSWMRPNAILYVRLLLWFVIESSLLVHASKITRFRLRPKCYVVFKCVCECFGACCKRCDECRPFDRDSPVDVSILLDGTGRSIGLPLIPTHSHSPNTVCNRIICLFCMSHNNRFHIRTFFGHKFGAFQSDR